MKLIWIICLLLFSNFILVALAESYYSIIAPGLIKSNRNYTVTASLLEATEPAIINIRIEGPSYQTEQDVHLKPFETKLIVFVVPKLLQGEYKLIAEGIHGIRFRNESRIFPDIFSGPKIYIQTDKAVYKPGDVVQFRIVLLDEHTRPLKIDEPIRVEILDANDHRVKQFKDILFLKGMYKNKFQLSRYPVEGSWKIHVTISGKYNYSETKYIKVQDYVLPKFNVYIKVAKHFLPEDRYIKALVYGKYLFDKYVEGNLTAYLMNERDVLQYKPMNISSTQIVEFDLESPEELQKIARLTLRVELMEKHTGITRYEELYIAIKKQRYNIQVNTDSIQYQDYKPYRLKASVRHWNDAAVVDPQTPIRMLHGSKEYQSFVDSNGVALFEFVHERDANHVFRYKDSTYTLPNIYIDEQLTKNYTDSYCRLRLMGDRPRLGNTLQFEITSIESIPYINYIIVGHASIVKSVHIKLPANKYVHIFEITPGIDMVPDSFIYVYFVQNGHFRYDELKMKFPQEFENQISITAPKQVKPGQEVTIELNGQPKSYVGLLAVDLGVYLLDPSYDLKRKKIIKDLEGDLTFSPVDAILYPGIISGVFTLTNAHYLFIKGFPDVPVAPARQDPLYFRQKFPETWIFENYEILDINIKLKFTVPDTITTWRITAFTVNEISGFGIVDGPTDIIALQTFFIILNLPYSVKRGEIVNIPIIVYNYHNRSLDTEITLYNRGQQFNFMNSSTGSKESSDRYRVVRINVPSNGIEKIEILIKPRLVGELALEVTAENFLASDAVIQKLKVEPEGVRKSGNKAIFAKVGSSGTFTSSFIADIPEDIVPGSEYLTISVGGGTLAPTFKNLNNLVQLPTGCGEQNMLNFAPDILVLDYLKATGRLFKERNLVAKAKNFIEIGYQQQLSYRHTDGGYSVFGPSHQEVSSTWLTAYVIRFFIKALKYLAIEPTIINSGLELLAKKQLENGEFLYTGYVFYSAQQNRYGFTAFVLMTFLEDRKYASKYKTTIENGLTFLNTNLDRINDVYALSLVATVLQMAKHGNAHIISNKLKVHKLQSANRMWWSQNDKNAEKDVEITAYVLLALLDADNDATEDANIMEWLIEQRNEQGGFKSTQDTVVGLQALVKYSEKYSNLDLNLNVQYVAVNRQKQQLETGLFMVDKKNMLVFQTKELPLSTRAVEVRVSGSGYSLVQFAYHYHMGKQDPIKRFHITPHAELVNDEQMTLEICFHYNSSEANTNMVILEASLPSGFQIDDDLKPYLLESEYIQRFEAKNSDTTVFLYFEKIEPNVEFCQNIWANKVHDVQELKPAPIAIYNYYNSTHRDTVFYSF